ncbi:HalX domain-containing protein [Halovenus aranensis]|uniref:HalX domain-containing protein n=1 Tax=Halovenus aranensis TaxID=890420 RepID=A0A1G8VCQ4_9EURY|nr:response regulator [Halovenus aranensis]SDJ63739.1 HalX domain-containing protein [Halovenus aranensis]
MTERTDRPRILIADDEERVAKTYELRLSREYDTAVVLSGEEALQEIDDSFNVVLLDRRMPDLSGDRVLEEIRRRGIDCRVVMVTAVDPDFDITEMDVDDYVVKPVNKDELHEVVERAMTISEYNAQVQELSALKLKRNVLEVEMARTELEDSPEYQTLTEQIDELESNIDEFEETLDLDQVDLHL